MPLSRLKVLYDELKMNIRRGDPYHNKPQSGFYYSRGQQQSSAPSPSISHSSNRHTHDMPLHTSGRDVGRRTMDPRIEDSSPSYNVEHLATFAVGRQFGLTFPADGIRKLKQMEKNSAIWAQPFVMRFKQSSVTVEDENGDLVEQFPLDLIEQPTAHVTSDHKDPYNNILLFVVREDNRGKRTANPTEMHIFQCVHVAATDVADDLQAYLRGQFKKVKNGRRSARQGSQGHHPGRHEMPQYPPDDASISSDSSELFERDVNTLNRCFDDIERFVARIQSAALAQRELEQQAHRYRTAQRRDKRQSAPAPPDPNGILHMRAQLPLETEFIDILRKFKLSFNLLAKLKNHIHEPNAPELLHFLFTPLTVILDGCQWGLGRNIAPQIVAPLLSLEARELMQNCLSSKESDVWMSLGESWRTPPEDWPGPLPPPYRPVFLDGFAPYGLPDSQRSHYPPPIKRGESEPPAHYKNSRERSGVDTAPSTPMSNRPRQRPHRNMSVDNLDLDRLSLEKERLDFERSKMIERERRLLEEEKQIREERARLSAERRLINQEDQQQQARPPPNFAPSPQPSPMTGRAPPRALPPMDPDQSPRQKAFVNEIINRGCKLVIATFDRVAQNPKELTVSRGEYLEVLDDSKNWWECKNVHQRVGYVPHTILSVVPIDHNEIDNRDVYRTPQDNHSYPNGHQSSPKPAVKMVSDAGVQASVVQTVQAPPRPIEPPVPPVPPVPDVPPPPDMRQMILDARLRHVEAAVAAAPPPPKREEPKASIFIGRREGHQDLLVNELAETVGRRDGQILTKNRKIPSVQISERSSPEQVTIWLEEKGFSPRVIDLLGSQDGADLFSLNKPSLMQACGRDEGSRLYSLLLVQKQRSGYETHTNKELKAILKFRKTHVEVTNEAPADEPSMPVNGDI